MNIAHITALCYASYYQRRQNLCPDVRSSTAADFTKTLVQALVTCCLDYCSSLLYGMSNNLLQ